MTNSKIFFGMVAMCMILSACDSKPKEHHDQEQSEHMEHEHDHDHDADEEHGSECDQEQSCNGTEAHSGEKGVKDITFDASKLSSGLFQIEKVEKRNFFQVIRVGGQLLPVTNGIEHLVAPGSGVIRFSGNALYPGVGLSKGQIVAYLSSNGMGEGDAQAKAMAAFKKAKAEFDRVSGLIKDQLVSQREYEQAMLEYENAKLSYQIWNKDARGVRIVVPQTSYLQKLSVQNGDFVQAGQILATLSRKDRLCLQANVPQRYADRVKWVKSANFSLAGQNNVVYSIDQKQGKLISIGQNYSESGTIPISFEISGKDLFPGSMVEVFLKLSEHSQVIAVPIGALTEEQGAYYVYVFESGHVYNKRPVEVGESDGQRVHILSGIDEGDLVVVKGAYYVKMAGFSGSIPHGHQH